MKKTNLLLLLLTTLLCACNFGGEESIESKVEYIPFQSEENGRWGMVSTNGEVLFEDEFKETPTMAMNGRFLVQNSDEEWEIYTAEKKPKQVGDTYKEICPFTEKVTPAVQEGKPVALIDRDGKEVVSLAKIDGKSVASVRQFQCGIAVYETTDGLYGAIDTKGKTVIKAEYMMLCNASDGKVIGIDKKYKKHFAANENDKIKYSVLSASNGKTLGEISGKEVGSYINDHFEDGLLVAGKKKGDEVRFGLLDEKGEWKVKPNSKFEYIGEIRNGHFTFSHNGKCGIADIEGNVVVRAKYTFISFRTDETAVAYDYEKDFEDQAMLIDFNGERVGSERFNSIYSYLGDGQYAPVCIDKNEYGFINTKGELLECDKNIDLYDIVLNSGYSSVESDYVDMDAVVEALDITKTSLDGISLGISGEQAAKSVAIKKGAGDVEAKDYNYTSTLSYTKGIGRVEASFTLQFNWSIAEPIKESYTEYFYGYPYTYEKTVGYRFDSTSKATHLYATFSNEGKLKGKTRQLCKALMKKAATLGRTVKKTSNGIIIDLGNNTVAEAYTYNGQANFMLAKGSPNDFYIPEDDSADEAETDTIACDSAVADSVAW